MTVKEIEKLKEDKTKKKQQSIKIMMKNGLMIQMIIGCYKMFLLL